MVRSVSTSSFALHFAASLALSLGALALLVPDAAAQDRLEGRQFQSVVRPLLKKYCYECHAEDVTEADIDLASFTSITDVREQTEIWLKVRTMIDSGQMPPKESEPLGDLDRDRLSQWVRDFLAREAESTAGDPGPIVLRRLNNAEYTYTVRDLTGIQSLDPTREFPVDGAAGEGFTNVGSGQAMSPALVQKYLNAAKTVAAHAVLVPDGIRFSRYTTRRDQTDELLARIQSFYRRYTADGGGSAVDLQGIKFETNQGGVLPIERYLAATLDERASLQSKQKTIQDVASQRSLNARYLGTLWETLTSEGDTSPWLAALRKKWRGATADDAKMLAAEISAAQDLLWKFNPVGQVGREGGPTRWLEAVSPVTTSQQLRLKFPDTLPRDDVIVYLAAGDAGDGNDDDWIVWRRPRIEFGDEESGSVHPPVLLRDVRAIASRIDRVVATELPRTAEYLAAIVELQSSDKRVREVAESHSLNPRLLMSWADFVGLGQRGPQRITGLFRHRLTRMHGYDVINGWGKSLTPSLLTNRSDQPVSFLTLTIPARGVTVHPSPDSESIVAWRSPLDGTISIRGLVADADDRCGNGAAWRVVRRSTGGSLTIADGVIDNGGRQPFDAEFQVDEGDVVSMIINARDENHGCDTTHIKLKLAEVGGQQRRWNLAGEIVDKVLEGNPLPDSYGNGGIWHFCASGELPTPGSAVPADSALGRWRLAVVDSRPADETQRLALAVQDTLSADRPTQITDADRQVREKLRDWRGPLHWISLSRDAKTGNVKRDSAYGLDPSHFGKHPDGRPLDDDSLCVQAPSVLAVRLPPQLVAGAELVAAGTLHPKSVEPGSAQLRMLLEKPDPADWLPDAPILVREGSRARQRVEQGVRSFRDLFPPVLCYARIVPVDEVVTLTLFHREDDHLRRLMLNEHEVAELERMWEELYFVSREPLKLVVVYEQLSEFATQDRPDLVKALAPMRVDIQQRADLFRRRLIQTEPAHLDAAVRIARQAWRRPLTAADERGLRELYAQIRSREVSHDEAMRLVLARIMTSPKFLYKLERPGSGVEARHVTDHELATRLSYFLWSSLPDESLRAAADAGSLDSNSATLIAQARRMLHDARTRRLAIQFACQWLHVRDFDSNDDKNEQLYPEFAELRGDMYEETVRFFEEMFRNHGSILDTIGADHTYLNPRLARHYGFLWPETAESDRRWLRVDDVRAQGRGGVLGMATFLASQSGASRTSPILRGNWVYETLLGERLPRPPTDVPQLPEAVPVGRTARELIEKHSSVAACAKCHVKIDPYGFALEQYDAIGRLRTKSVDTKTTLEGGEVIDGVNGLRDYLMNQRREDFVRQFCRKLLGYALGREVQLSDEPLLREIQQQLARSDYRFDVAVELIVTSEQFRKIRSRSRLPGGTLKPESVEDAASDALEPAAERR